MKKKCLSSLLCLVSCFAHGGGIDKKEEMYVPSYPHPDYFRARAAREEQGKKIWQDFVEQQKQLRKLIEERDKKIEKCVTYSCYAGGICCVAMVCLCCGK